MAVSVLISTCGAIRGSWLFLVWNRGKRKGGQGKKRKFSNHSLGTVENWFSIPFCGIQKPVLKTQYSALLGVFELHLKQWKQNSLTVFVYPSHWNCIFRQRQIKGRSILLITESTYVCVMKNVLQICHYAIKCIF